MKTVNLITLKENIHLFDQPVELSLSDNKPSQFYNAILNDNYTFDDVFINYNL